MKYMPTPGSRVLIITAVAAEKEAILRGLHGDLRFEVLAGGVGSAAAAVNTAAALAAGGYGLVVCAGIGGGFAGRAEVGSLVVAVEIVAADLGAETSNGFLSVDELGFGSSRIPIDTELAARVCEAFEIADLTVHTGPILTVSTATGTSESAARLMKRVPKAAAEAMEGFGAAIAAQHYGVPFLEIRAVSNLVGPRDRAAWRIEVALQALEAASSILVEVL